MSVLLWMGLGLAINVAIVVVVRSFTKDRPKMSYTDYLEKYGRSEGYTGDDVEKFM